MAGALKAIGKFAKKIGKGAYDQSNVKRGVDAFRSWKKKPAEQAQAGGGFKPAPKQVGEFKTGIDSNLKVPKVSSLGRGELFSSKTMGGGMG